MLWICLRAWYNPPIINLCALEPGPYLALNTIFRLDFDQNQKAKIKKGQKYGRSQKDRQKNSS